MAKPQSNVPIVYQTLIQAGLSPAQASGLVGRFQQESGPGLNTTAHGDRSIEGGSHGIGQWNRERKANLLAFGGENWTDPRVQARFALHEMGIGENNGAPGYGSEAGAGRRLLAANTIEDAGIAARGYERPQGWTADNPTAGHGYRNTIRNAQTLFDEFGGMQSSANPITDYSIGPKDATGQNEFWNPISPGGRGPGAKVPEPPPGSGGAPGSFPYSNPISGYGGGPAGAVPPAGKGKKTWQDMLTAGIEGFGSLGGAGSVPTIPTSTPTQTRMTPTQAIAPVMDQNSRRDQLAQALARLNTGRLFAG